ncbi:MAG: TonB-dependent receptor [Cyanophyceae cyanobacterium]
MQASVSAPIAEQLSFRLSGSYEARDGYTENTLVGFPTGESITRAEIEETTFALFGQTSYQPTEALTLTVGLRYESFDTTLKNKADISNFEGFPPSVIRFEDIEQDDDILLPRFVAQYRFSPSLMAYGSIARGYKPAGVNFGGTTEELLRFETETSYNYELGLKSSWFNDRLLVNLAAFYSPVEDFQLQAVDDTGLTRQIANTDADIAGFEVEVRANPFEGFEAIAGFGYVDATFDEFTNPFRNEFIDGQRLPYSPDYTYNLALQYRAPFGLFTRLELQGFGTTFFDNPNEFEQEPFVLVNAHLGYEVGNYGIYFFANNIFDVEHLTTAFNFGSLGNIASYGAPATLGFQVRTEF